MSRMKIALAGIGKIARDAHVPALMASDAFELVAAVTRHEPPEGARGFRSISEMKAALPDVAAVSICTPPRGRLQLIAEAFDAGLDVMIEKPPAATLSEARQFADMAARAGCVLFVTWHSRAAAAVEPAKEWLRGKEIKRVEVSWKEDIRIWHPGQSWIWEPGLGAFDAGINAFSVLTHILPGALTVEDAELRFPANKDAPIAADIRLAHAHAAPVLAAFDFDQRGPQTWTIDIETDGGRLALSDGASAMSVDGEPVRLDGGPEYHLLYRQFQALLEDRRSDADLRPFELVADCFLLGRRKLVAPFEDF
ncbi:Gfo/Idh/MocA family protein [Amphiplicatus metriothermophilus]|uniref:Galactose 1-dehydrogenase n=1 Tax=Amphiplicatus metriothermophilus TaxID=1519374 RepID=A0A239PXW7_9PROT|nr:Gfo/Idh/MocA family oxidoreductase [Amphiplicatus metriothermophilus]MBB5519803.1 D-galactose 1-dehydrogenase [Amphiplicatus metriothermophilus]SNT75161.1 galactose 1-dehydrogenase [Amphiplicatus metriothermophilus]